MAKTNLTYQKWLQARGQTSSYKRAGLWAAAAGRPAPKRKNVPPTPTQVPGPTTPKYTGYAGHVDPAFGGSPLSLPADPVLAWTGTSNPDLAEIGRGGYTNLTPRKRTGGGWDVFGNLADPTPKWGTDYLAQLKQREIAHTAYADTTVKPWLANVMGQEQSANQSAQAGLANLMASVNTRAANVGMQAPPVGMTGVGANPEAYKDIAQQGYSQDMAGLRTAEGAQNAMLGNAQVSSAAAFQNASLSQQVNRLPQQYEQMRMDFTKELGQITEQIKENQRAREFQRQQLLEQRREFGINTAEAHRAALESEKIQRGALGVQQAEAVTSAAKAQTDANQAAADAVLRKVPDIRNSLNAGETLLSNKGKGFNQRPGMEKFHGRPVDWEQAQDGKWYGTVGKVGAGGGGAAGGEDPEKYQKRFSTYVADLPGKFRGKVHPVTQPDKSVKWVPEPSTKSTYMDVVRDMVDVQHFKPVSVWKAMQPYLDKMTQKDPQLRQTREGQTLRTMFEGMSGSDSARIMKLMKITGYNGYIVRKRLGLNPNAGAV